MEVKCIGNTTAEDIRVVYIASDHAGFALKETLLRVLCDTRITDLGVYTDQSPADYTIYAKKLVHAMYSEMLHRYDLEDTGCKMKKKVSLSSSPQSYNEFLNIDENIVDNIGIKRKYSQCNAQFIKIMSSYTSLTFNVFGILICGSGLGMSIAANRYMLIRAALCTSVTYAMLARQHNDANVLVLGGRLLDAMDAIEITKVFLNTSFSEKKRHKRRILSIEDA